MEVSFAVVGDVVESRRFQDSGDLVERLGDVFTKVNEAVEAIQPIAFSIRDEFHGVYGSAYLALEASLRLRLLASDLVLPTVNEGEESLEVRMGIGSGEVVTTENGHQTGSAWWNAHDARQAAQTLPTKSRWPSSLRTWVLAEDPLQACQINAYLLLQDQLLARMDAGDRRALRGLMDGERQTDIARDLGVTQPTVARRVRDRGALAMAAALAQWRKAEAGSGN